MTKNTTSITGDCNKVKNEDNNICSTYEARKDKLLYLSTLVTSIVITACILMIVLSLTTKIIFWLLFN